ncbi:MAG: hypothetical protein WCT04_24370 [Planctomycetota bacterium]
MSKTVARGKVFAVTVEVDDERLALFKKAPELVEKALDAGALYWQTGILPDHFKSGAGAKYGYAARSMAYIKRNGGKPYLTHSGQLRDDLLSKSATSMSGRTLTMKISSNVLNLVPAMSDSNEDLYVKHSNKKASGYPNLKREIRTMLSVEREQIMQVIEDSLRESFNPETTAKLKRNVYAK